MEYYLKMSKISLEEIHSIEIVGGSSRIPKFKRTINEEFGKAPIATMNQDEAVSRGAFLKSRISKTKKNFQIVEMLEFDLDKLDLHESDQNSFVKISQVI